MEKRNTYYVSRKNALTWIAAILMVCSVGFRIAYYVCGKGTDATTMWLQLILPAAACLIFAAILLLDGQEHFYRTALPVALLAIYFVAVVVSRGYPKRYIFLNALVYLAFVIFYKQLTSGHVRKPGLLLPLMFAAALAVLAYDRRQALFSAEWDQYFGLLPDVLLMAGGLLMTFAIHPHLDSKYHPTWGDRSDGRRIRTMHPMNVVIPYIMVNRNESNNFLRDEVEISNLEKYVREKRKEGYSNMGITHVFIAAYVRCVAKYPALNRFLSGQRVYSRGDDIQFCMTIKKELTVESDETCIKLHLKPTDTIFDVYEKMDKEVQRYKTTDQDSDSNFDATAKFFTLLPGLVFKFAIWFLQVLDYFGWLPKFILEVSPFHGSVFFTSMGSLGIPAIVHHLYDFGNLPAFVAFGKKFRRNEIANDGTVEHKKYMDMTFNLDERICDGFYYAAVLKYLNRLLANPEQLDVPPEKVEEDIP